MNQSEKRKRTRNQIILSFFIAFPFTFILFRYSYVHFPKLTIQIKGDPSFLSTNVEREFFLDSAPEERVLVLEVSLVSILPQKEIFHLFLNGKSANKRETKARHFFIDFPGPLLKEGKNSLLLEAKANWKFQSLKIKNLYGYSKNILSLIVFPGANSWPENPFLSNPRLFVGLISFFVLSFFLTLFSLRKESSNKRKPSWIKGLKLLLLIFFLFVLFFPFIVKYKIILEVKTFLGLSFLYLTLDYLHSFFPRKSRRLTSPLKTKMVHANIRLKTLILPKLQHLWRKNETLLIALMVILLPTFFYLKTLLPGLGYTGDTAKFQFIGKILGIPHAPGYPLYALLNHIFVQIPLKSIAFRANLMSAFFAVLTIFFLYLAIRLIIKNKIFSSYAALFLAFTYTFWSQSNVAEVYTLNSFFLALVFYLLVKWKDTENATYFRLFLFSYALSFGNHLTMITILPALLIFIFLLDRKRLLELKSIAIALLSLVTISAVYSYLLIRTHQNAAYLENRVTNVKTFLRVITAKGFQAKMFSFSLPEILQERIPDFFVKFFTEWRAALFFLGIIGCVYLWKKERKLFWLFSLSFLGQTIYILNYDIPDISIFFIPVFLIFTIFIGLGISAVAKKAEQSKSLLFIFHFLVLFLLLQLIISNYPKVDRSGEKEADERLSALFENLSPHSLVLTDNYLDRQYVFYKMFAEYPEKPILNLELVPEKDIRDQLCRKLSAEVSRKKSLQKHLFPASVLDLQPGELAKIFKENKEVQQKLLSQVYLISVHTKELLESQNITVRKAFFSSKKDGKMYLFYKVFLDELCTLGR